MGLAIFRKCSRLISGEATAGCQFRLSRETLPQRLPKILKFFHYESRSVTMERLHSRLIETPSDRFKNEYRNGT